MPRFFVRWFPALLLTALVVTVGLAQDQSDEARKRAAFIKARQSETDSGDADESPSPKPKKAKAVAHKSPTPHAHASASAKPKAHKKSAETSEETPGEKKKSTHKAAEKPPSHEATTREGKTSTVAKSATAKPVAKKEEKESPAKATPTPLPAETPSAKPAPSVAKAMPVPSAAPTPAVVSAPNNIAQGQPAELTIEKTGYEQPHGFWYRVFHGNSSGGRGTGYHYLTASVRAEIDHAPADRRNPPWQFIVVHNSGTRQGNARVFDYYHRHVRHMPNGLAYHFVIGNGTSTGNGQIEVGDRWRRQINGGHVHSDNLNNIALGICLVGDFNRSQPSAAQLQSCEELIRYLRQRCGKVGNRYMVVKPHREMNPPRWPTDCPGDAFPYSWFRRFQ